MTSMPDALIIAYHLAECYMAGGQREDAKMQIDAMTRKYPDSILTAGLKFYYYLLEGDRPQAIVALNRMTVLLPYAPRPYVMLAALYWQEGKISLAEANAVKAMKLGEKTIFPYMLMGDILVSKRDFKQALSYYDRVLAVEPENVITLLQTGDLYLSQGQPKKAEERYRKALSISPRIKSIQTKIAWARAQGGDMEAALAMNERYLRDTPNDSQAVSAYANTLVAAKRLDDALNMVQSAIKRKPQAWELHYLLGDLFTIKKDFKNASSSYERALELNPSNINMALNIGARYENNALDADTEKFYLKILKKMPNNVMVENQLAWFYIERMGTPQRAKELIESLMAEKDWPEMKDTIAWYYYKLGNYMDAEHYFREALRLAPDRSESRARLALTLYSLKRNREAVSEAEKAIARLEPGPLKNSLQETMTRSGK
jgi:tetratricopeptide (TPR) repeat protein